MSTQPSRLASIFVGLCTIISHSAAEPHRLTHQNVEGYGFAGCGSSDSLLAEFLKVESVDSGSHSKESCGALCHASYVATFDGECYCPRSSISEPKMNDATECSQGEPKVYKLHSSEARRARSHRNLHNLMRSRKRQGSSSLKNTIVGGNHNSNAQDESLKNTIILGDTNGGQPPPTVPNLGSQQSQQDSDTVVDTGGDLLVGGDDDITPQDDTNVPDDVEEPTPDELVFEDNDTPNKTPQNTPVKVLNGPPEVTPVELPEETPVGVLSGPPDVTPIDTLEEPPNVVEVPDNLEPTGPEPLVATTPIPSPANVPDVIENVPDNLTPTEAEPQRPAFVTPVMSDNLVTPKADLEFTDEDQVVTLDKPAQPPSGDVTVEEDCSAPEAPAEIFHEEVPEEPEEVVVESCQICQEQNSPVIPELGHEEFDEDSALVEPPVPTNMAPGAESTPGPFDDVVFAKGSREAEPLSITLSIVGLVLLVQIIM